MNRIWASIATVALAGMLILAAGEGDKYKKYVNEYPSAMLKAEPVVKQRLQTLLGANNRFFMDRLQVESPIEVVSGFLTGSACQAHGCGVEMAMFFINMSNGKLSAAIRSDSYTTKDKVKIFSEEQGNFPYAAMNHVLGQ